MKQSTDRAAKSRTSNGPDPATTSGSPESRYDWDRLERAVRSLVDQQESYRAEVRDLRKQIAERDQHLRGLEAQLIESNQRRQDTGKRIDELIAQLDQLDAQFASAESGE